MNSIETLIQEYMEHLNEYDTMMLERTNKWLNKGFREPSPQRVAEAHRAFLDDKYRNWVVKQIVDLENMRLRPKMIIKDPNNTKRIEQ